jgi:hypothetical protein
VIRLGEVTHTLTVPRAFGAEVGHSILIQLPPEDLRVWSDGPPSRSVVKTSELTAAGQETA